jgi:sugar lactone lactonase YvrE
MNKSFTLSLAVALLLTACSKNNPGTPPPISTQGGSSVTTFAGTGAPGASDGSKEQASFNIPVGVAINSEGFLFVADEQNNAIRYISPQGTVTTIAGNGKVGFSNTADSVTFNEPSGVAVDNSGDVFVADRGNSAIRLITTTGTVVTFAGNGAAGFANGTGTSAMFSNPAGVAVDGAGNVYVADVGNNAIRKIVAKSALVSTFAGTGVRGSADGAATAATFNQPAALAVDAVGNVYVADTYNNKIRKITPQGLVSTFAGSGSPGSANGAGAAASFNQPTGIAIDASGNIYVADTNNNLIREITATGTVTTLAGTGSAGGANGTLTASTFNAPSGLAVDSYGRIFVADTGNSLIRLITP